MRKQGKDGESSQGREASAGGEVMARILGRVEVLERLQRGEVIHWLGGANFHAYMGNNETVRHDTLTKLYLEGLITGWGFPKMHGTISLKEV